jgi:hypothetical protein
MLSVSNSDFIAALALHKETTKPIAKVSPNVWLPFDATRVMLRDRGGIRKQAVDGDHCSQCRKDREQAVVGHAGGQREDTVLGHVGVDAQQDILPAPGRYLGGRRRRAAMAFICSRQTGGRSTTTRLLSRRRNLVFRRCEPTDQKSHRQQTECRSETPSYSVGLPARYIQGLAHDLLHHGS